MTANSTLNSPLPSVTIIGAGVCGLLLAHGLQKLGFPVSIVDKEPCVAQRSCEWTMTIHWGLSTMKEMLPPSVLSERRTAHTDPFYEYDFNRSEAIPFYNGYTGDLVMEARHVFRRVSRTRLRKVLSKVQNLPDPTDPSTWSFHVMQLWRPSGFDNDTDESAPIQSLQGPAAIAKIKQAASSPNLKELFRSSIQAIPDDSTFWVSQLRYWDTVPWDRSKMITLVGDAAHVVLPARGQGLNHGLGDIEKLITEFKLVKIGEQSAANALDVYHDDVFVRGRRAALESLEDADAISKIHYLTDSRVNRNGLAA